MFLVTVLAILANSQILIFALPVNLKHLTCTGIKIACKNAPKHSLLIFQTHVNNAQHHALPALQKQFARHVSEEKCILIISAFLIVRLLIQR